ncbi:MAG: hypothetical protein IJT00_01770 [Lachnospiraceae bacterium]|nr:hypothetical protein [Lachnospiraceae bacterium]
MSRRRVPDNWDGFDAMDHPYDEREERRFQSGIWIFLSVIFAGILVFITFNVARGLNLKLHGTRVVAEYDPESDYAFFYDENGLYHSLNMLYFKDFKTGEDKTVELYYLGSANDAMPMISPLRYFKDYLIFGALFGVCLWRALTALGVKPGFGKRPDKVLKEPDPGAAGNA